MANQSDIPQPQFSNEEQQAPVNNSNSEAHIQRNIQTILLLMMFVGLIRLAN
jgi:hypothetical protein